MRYILQIFTGGWDAPEYTADEIIERLDVLTARMAVDKVILGWYPERELYRPIGEYLRRKHIDMVLWLPVFAELEGRTPMKPAVDAWGQPLTKVLEQQGEHFVFACPTDGDNLQAVTDVYDDAFAQAGFSGVFLDRVRTQSFVGGVEGVLSCGCALCREALARHGVSASSVADAYARLGDRFFDADNDLLDAFLAAKQQVVGDSVLSLVRAFKARGLSVGLDVFAPSLSRYVGQSLSKLAKEADFLKPMLYRRTFAPAGIGYEYEMLRRTAPTATGHPTDVTELAFLKQELAFLKTLPCAVYAGLEVNSLPVIAPTDPAYVAQSLSAIEESGIEGAVLSWNVMRAPDEHLPLDF